MVLVEVEVLRGTMCRHIGREGRSDARPRTGRRLQRGQCFERESLSEEEKRRDQVVPRRIGAEVHEVQVVPIQLAARTGESPPRMLAARQDRDVRSDDADFVIASQFAGFSAVRVNLVVASFMQPTAVYQRTPNAS